jgi:hypothetical protein
LKISRSTGKFHGVMAATTPSGLCWRTVGISPTKIVG